VGLNTFFILVCKITNNFLYLCSQIKKKHIVMNLIEKKILSDGVIEPGDILKINNFLNQQIEPEAISFIAQKLKNRFEGIGATKILTIEISGIPIATMLGHYLNLPAIFARKQEILNVTDGMYVSQAFSFTHKQQNKVYVPTPFISSTDKILIIDDFMANGEACRALIDIVSQADATIVGIGIAIEKGFMKGGKELRAEGYRVESVAIIDEMDYHTQSIRFRDNKSSHFIKLRE
jgi:xanthine phosphoribosyltransferase